jgi:hypothetical protein
MGMGLAAIGIDIKWVLYKALDTQFEKSLVNRQEFSCLFCAHA